jgi:hypothetical protein
MNWLQTVNKDTALARLHAQNPQLKNKVRLLERAQKMLRFSVIELLVDI